MKVVLCCIAGLILVGCGDTIDSFDPVVDGYKSPAYNQDLAQCRELSKQANQQVNEDMKTGAIVGAVLGAALSKDGERAEGAAAGAAGVALGVGANELEEADARKQRILVTCMQRRGHNVLG